MLPQIRTFDSTKQNQTDTVIRIAPLKTRPTKVKQVREEILQYKRLFSSFASVRNKQ